MEKIHSQGTGGILVILWYFVVFIIRSPHLPLDTQFWTRGFRR